MRVDLRRALEASRELIDMWLLTQRFPDFPPYTGGILDSWPNWAVEAFSIADLERQRIHDFRKSQVPR